MKRTLKLLGILLILVIMLTGCEASEKNRSKILKKLQKEKIVSKNIKQVDYQSYTTDTSGLGSVTEITYIYEDKDENLIGIKYIKNSPVYYAITVYTNIKVNEEAELKEASEIEDNKNAYEYKYENGKYSIDPQYILKDEENYLATKKLFGFKIEEKE